MKPTYPSNNRNYGRCQMYNLNIPYDYNGLPLRSPYWRYQKPYYRKYIRQESWSKRHPSTRSNEARRRRWKPHTNPMEKGRRRRRIERRKYYEKDRWKQKRYQKRKSVKNNQKEIFRKRKSKKEGPTFSWYKRGQMTRFRNEKEQKENIKKILNEILTNQGEEIKVEFTYNKKTKLFYNVQYNTFISKKELKEYDVKKHLEEIDNEKYRRGNYHYLKKDTEPSFFTVLPY